MKVPSFLLTLTVLRLTSAKISNDLDPDDEEWEFCSLTKPPPVCKVMAPRGGIYPPQDVSTSPWKIYTWKETIQQLFSQPITLGSDKGEEIFNNYILTARAVEGGRIVGHFEYQWDAIPICCYENEKEFSYEGPKVHPNLLYGSEARVRTPNQTVLWTAPKHFEGKIVFLATFTRSSRQYWSNVTSTPVEVIKRDEKRFPFNKGSLLQNGHDEKD